MLRVLLRAVPKLPLRPTQRVFSGRRNLFPGQDPDNPFYKFFDRDRLKPTEEPYEINPHRVECTYLNEDKTVDLDKAILEAIRDIQDPKYKGRRKGALWFNDMLNDENCTTLQGERFLMLAIAHGQARAIHYSQLTHKYAQKGDVDGILDVIKRMNKAGYPTDEPTFADLAYAYFLNEKYHKVLEIFDDVNEDGYRAGLGLYMSSLYSSRMLKDEAKETEILTKMVQDGFDTDVVAKNVESCKAHMRELQEDGQITLEEEACLVQDIEESIPSFMFPLKSAPQNVKNPQTM